MVAIYILGLTSRDYVATAYALEVAMLLVLGFSRQTVNWVSSTEVGKLFSRRRRLQWWTFPYEMNWRVNSYEVVIRWCVMKINCAGAWRFIVALWRLIVVSWCFLWASCRFVAASWWSFKASWWFVPTSWKWLQRKKPLRVSWFYPGLGILSVVHVAALVFLF